LQQFVYRENRRRDRPSTIQRALELLRRLVRFDLTDLCLSGDFAMAKGLKIGDAVTVREEMRLRRKDPAYVQGLKRLRPGDIGQVVDAAEGRSVVVEFAGKRVTLASQRLDRAQPPAAPEPVESGKGSGADAGGRESDLIRYVNTNDPQFITGVANKLLVSGGGDEAVVVQIRLADLPRQVQRQVRSLMDAKLALGPQGRLPAAGRKTVRRGRKPRNPAP
jgi:hypothetical protein